MPQQTDPRVAQWQQRFDRASRMASDPQRPGETPEAFRERKASATQLLRHLQMSRPREDASRGQQAPQAQQAQPPAQSSGGGMFGGLYDLISRAMGGGQ